MTKLNPALLLLEVANWDWLSIWIKIGTKLDYWKKKNIFWCTYQPYQARKLQPGIIPWNHMIVTWHDYIQYYCGMIQVLYMLKVAIALLVRNLWGIKKNKYPNIVIKLTQYKLATYVQTCVLCHKDMGLWNIVSINPFDMLFSG